MSGHWQRFRDSTFLYELQRDRVAMASLAMLLSLVALSFSAPLVAPFDPYDPTQIDIMDSEIPSALVLVLLVLVINLLGDWLRDALNPKLYKARSSG